MAIGQTNTNAELLRSGVRSFVITKDEVRRVRLTAKKDLKRRQELEDELDSANTSAARRNARYELRLYEKTYRDTRNSELFGERKILMLIAIPLLVILGAWIFFGAFIPRIMAGKIWSFWTLLFLCGPLALWLYVRAFTINVEMIFYHAYVAANNAIAGHRQAIIDEQKRQAEEAKKAKKASEQRRQLATRRPPSVDGGGSTQFHARRGGRRL